MPFIGGQHPHDDDFDDEFGDAFDEYAHDMNMRDVGGAVDGFGNVHSDADMGL
ncbi:hypothetical protein AB0F17_34165 [Nonomuraea sp. NPDC026600]|uniref:hypothetical protein n=1 Tax=Nonomuraea sp. NPDC026600 TaxID=3155363 RepID=UPI0033DFD476